MGGYPVRGKMSRVYLGRLSYQAREKDVERFFRGFGRIRDINLKNGFGFVVGGHFKLNIPPPRRDLFETASTCNFY